MRATYPVVVQRLTLVAILAGMLSFRTEAQTPPANRALQKYVPTPEQLREGYARANRAGQMGVRVYKSQIAPHWFANDARFWYRNDLRDGMREFIAVDTANGKREPAFDHAKLAAGLSKAATKEFAADRLPFDSIDFFDDGKVIRFKVGDGQWKCDLATHEVTPTEPWVMEETVTETGAAEGETTISQRGEIPADIDEENDPPQQNQQQTQRQGQRFPTQQRTDRSPDGKWTAFLKENNVWLRVADDGREFALSEDGTAEFAYTMFSWSPDSQVLAAHRSQPGENKDVYLIESSPRGGGRAKTSSRPYALPGDRFTSYELNLFAITDRKQTKPAVDRVDFGRPRLRWKRDGRSFMYEQIDRGHQRFRLIEVDATSGSPRNIIDEKTETFIWTAHTESMGVPPVTWLTKSDELIHASERDGWRHLYLVDAATGAVIHRITQGEYVVRGIDRVDEDARQVWFRASGKNTGQDPYFIHFYRVNFDGTGLVALTAGNGQHTIAFSPDRKHLIDTYSRVDMPPVHELRRVSDGSLVCELERADAGELAERGIELPEVFVAKGRDGTTDIWGIICRPPRMDPTKKYPVVESIYAGPHGAHVPKSFSAQRRFSSLTELGFIVVQMDGMGTAHRSKAFHDVCWKNLKDAGFPDRILWHQAAAKKYPWYDVSRVGIYGTSAGGQNSTGALLFQPDFYKAAVSACGCHDNRMDKASWNEQWMGYPVGPQYAESSNIDNAHRLRGKLLLIVGELDTNVPPESTLRLADALIKAGKDFEFLLVPGMGHSNGGAYGTRRQQDFFVRHLHGVAPSDRNL